MTDNKKVIAILLAVAKKIESEKVFLTELDTAIGDGDHGINMARGFQKVEEKLPSLADKDIGVILKTVGMQLVSTVGGTAGPLYGTAFMQAGTTCRGKMELDFAGFAAAFAAAVQGVKMRGKAEPGEKTMLDALCPALAVIESEVKAGSNAGKALANAVQAAKDGVAYTKTIIATKGRASYLGERSLGHQDPGATSSLLILQAIAECI
ncbi:MAG: dihydroxyacetone kinase subunit DhaL [Selenomonadaceae bacterium]